MNAIKNIRLNVLKMKQHEFAAVAGVDQGTVSRWERGDLMPSLEAAAKIREAAKGKRGWSDKLFFEAPKSEQMSEAS